MKPLLLPVLLLVSSHALSSTIVFQCSFDSHSSPDGLQSDSKPFEFNYLVDTDADKAYIVGNQGSEEVKSIMAADSVTFIEVTPSNNVNSTTVVLNNARGSMGRAVHSRHVVVNGLGEMIPSQYYGRCLPKE